MQNNHLNDPTRSKVVIWVKRIQTELTVKIWSKSLVRVMGKVLLIINKQLFWWFASITLDNNNAVLTDV